MATSVLMVATDHQTTNPGLPFPQDHDHHPIRRSSGRRKPKGCDSAAGQKKTKQPQRGMGVEKLERLRLQQGWKEINSTTNQSLSIPVASFSDPTLMNVSGPVQLSKLGGYGAPNVGQVGLNQNQSFLGFHGQMDVGMLASDQLRTDLFGIGRLNNSDFLGKNVSGFSKELSSTPNVVKCYSEHCNACHKKKKFNGENLGCGTVRSDMYRQMCNAGDCGFLGLNIGDNQNIINQENQGLGTKTPLVPQVGYAVGNCKQCVDVVALHRKGSSSSEGGGVLMEYEFFPSGKGSCSRSDSHNDELGLVGASETSSSSMAGFDASNCIDLSLKLSY